MTWQPIETAPKGERRVLVTWGNPECDAQVAWQSAFYDTEEWRWCATYQAPLPWAPTHWAPLPKPPAQGDQSPLASGVKS